MDPKRYDELHGNNNWKGLLQPLDLDLRVLILSYGDLTSAAERSFNEDGNSKYKGCSYYGKSSFFEGSMLPWADKKYQVTTFIYATAHFDLSAEGNAVETNWIGYIAVSNDEFSSYIGRREICVVWRGTSQDCKWVDSASTSPLVPVKPVLPVAGSATDSTPEILEPWLAAYTTSDPDSLLLKSSARDQLLGRTKELLIQYKNEKVSITCTGHGLGACLTVLSAFDLATNVVQPSVLVSAFIFGCIQVGNDAFKAKVEGQPNLKILRVKNEPDLVSMWPSKHVKWTDGNPSLVDGETQYVDIGIEILIDSRKSPYLKSHGWEIDGAQHPSLVVYHDLEAMLHTLSGWNGPDGEFDWSLLKRSLALVNLSIDLLKAEYKIPASWWVETNKDMELREDGNWILSSMDREDHNLPVY